MTFYTNFLGIDIGKSNFVVSIYNSKITTEYQNSPAGISAFISDHKNILSDSLCILEPTGGYELELAYSLIASGYKLHRANARKVKNFIRSFGNSAKTDALDAKALAQYGHDRADSLNLFTPQSIEEIQLFQLVQRRNDLKKMLIAEKSRLQSPSSNMVRSTITDIIVVISRQVEVITDKIHNIIESNSTLRAKKEILKTIPGIGDVVAFELLILLPEIGQLCRRKIAALAGVAPRANDSGKFSGYRRVAHGRTGIKPVLFLAAMAARKSKTSLKEFYEKLINNGKKKMVALTALMRKILVIANAKLRALSDVSTEIKI